MRIQAEGHNAGRDLIRTAVTQALQWEALAYTCLIAFPSVKQE